MARRSAPTGIANRAGRGRRRASGLPGIAVLPYFTFGDEIVKSDFTTFLTERITATLMRVHDLHVTSFGSALNLGRQQPIQDVGATLGVEYVLKGQVTRVDQTLHVTQTLYDAQTGTGILQINLDRSLSDLLEIEREVVSQVVAKVLRPLRDSEFDRILDKRSLDDSAYELIVRAQLAMHKMTRRASNRADVYLTRALELAPDHAEAHAWRARYHSIRIGQGWAPCRKTEAELAMVAAARAVDIDGDNALALAVLGHMRSFLLKDYDTAERLLRRAVGCGPNEPAAHMFLGATLSYLGRGREAREHNEYALSLSPEDSCLYALLFFACLACYIEGDYEQSLEYAQQALALNPKYSTTVKLVTVINVALGRIAQAREMAALLRKLEPEFQNSYPPATPLIAGPLRDAYYQRLRTAGCFDTQPIGPSRPRKRKA